MENCLFSHFGDLHGDKRNTNLKRNDDVNQKFKLKAHEGKCSETKKLIY